MKTNNNSNIVRSAASLALAAGFSALLFSGCGGGASAPEAKKAASEAKAALPADLFASEPLKGAKSLKETLASAKKGDEVTVAGKIGGRAKPFTEGRAVFTLADDSLEFCSADDGHCATPWDACCVAPDEIKASVAAVQVPGAKGLPLKADLKGEGGLEPGAQVVVQGSVRESSDGGGLVIDARRVWASGG